MAGSKLDVLWSPIHHDKFIIWGQDLTLYDVSNLQDIPKNTAFTQLCPTRGATVVASQSASGVRCVDISAIMEHSDPLLALGHGSGRVSLTSFKHTYDSLGLVGKEFVPRYPRQCNSVSWNRTESNLLAVGMDKHRSDSAVLLWDVQAGAADEFGESGAGGPLGAAGGGEAAGCVTWCGFAPRTVLASMTSKHIKIFDLRENPGKASGSVSTRQWAGATSCGWLVAARGEGGEASLGVRDARMLTRALTVLPLQRPARKIHWSPTRPNLLISLQRDSTTLRLHDIQHVHDTKPRSSDGASAGASAEEGGGGSEGGAVERDVSVGGAPLASFACHPAHRARLLTLTTAGCVAEYVVMERVCVSWGAGGALAWGGASLRVLRPARLPLGTPDLDISYKARARALNDYGLKPDLWQNAELAEDEALSSLWHFLALSKSLVEDGCIRNGGWKHPGVRSVLRSPGEGYRSEAVAALLPDLPGRKVTVYRSAERTRALQLCGWGWGWDNAGAGVERAEAEGTPCRAAALAAFHLRLRTALDVLARARAPELRVAALALAPAAAGAPEERLWRDALAAAAPALPDPYLRAMLRFVAAAAPAPPPPAPPHRPDFSDVLGETGMRLEDRVAFACIFLPDGKLHEYLSETWTSLRGAGSLSALLLAGAGAEGLGALQRWLERGADVQSAALLAARAGPPELLREPRVAAWLAEYRALLDAWRLWWPRCQLDTWLAAAGAGADAGSGAAVACTYCGKPVAAAAGARPRPAFARLPPPAAKMKQVSSCPNCRKPLPRCGVCSLHLGTGAGAGGPPGPPGGPGPPAPSGPSGGAPGPPGPPGAAFAGWFSWCVACRHGGHAAHLLQWFSEHAECPVSSCSCRCSELDPPDVPRAV